MNADSDTPLSKFNRIQFMDYDNNAQQLLLPEYGRNILKMVEHALTIPDRDERLEYAKRIIEAMGAVDMNTEELGEGYRKYSYLPTLDPKVSYRLTRENSYEKAEILMEVSDEHSINAYSPTLFTLLSSVAFLSPER